MRKKKIVQTRDIHSGNGKAFSLNSIYRSIFRQIFFFFCIMTRCKPFFHAIFFSIFFFVLLCIWEWGVILVCIYKIDSLPFKNSLNLINFFFPLTHFDYKKKASGGIDSHFLIKIFTIHLTPQNWFHIYIKKIQFHIILIILIVITSVFHYNFIAKLLNANIL